MWTVGLRRNVRVKRLSDAERPCLKPHATLHIASVLVKVVRHETINNLRFEYLTQTAKYQQPRMLSECATPWHKMRMQSDEHVRLHVAIKEIPGFDVFSDVHICVEICATLDQLTCTVQITAGESVSLHTAAQVDCMQADAEAVARDALSCLCTEACGRVTRILQQQGLWHVALSVVAADHSGSDLFHVLCMAIRCEA